MSNPYERAPTDGGSVTARELLARGVERADALSGQPELQATLLAVTGRIHYNLGDLAQAEALLSKALDTWERVEPRPDLEAEQARVRHGLARAITGQDRFDEAEPLLRRVIETRGPAGDDIRPLALLDLYATLHALDRPEAADSAFIAWQMSVVRTVPVTDVRTAARMVELGNILGYRGQVRGEPETLRRGIALVDGALVTLRASEGERHPTVAHALNRKAALLIALLALAPAAEPLDTVVLALADSVTRASVELHREIFDGPNNDFWESLTNRATVLLHRKEYDEAELVARESLAAGEAIAGRASTTWIAGASLLADIDIARGEYGRAARTLREIRDAWARDHGDDYLLTLTSDLALGDALTRDRQFEAAETRLLNAWEKLNAQRGSADRFTRSAVAHLVTLYEQWNRPEQAARFRELRDAQAANMR